MSICEIQDIIRKIPDSEKVDILYYLFNAMSSGDLNTRKLLCDQAIISLSLAFEKSKNQSRDLKDELKRAENKNNPYFQEYFETVKKLINDCEILYNKLSDDGIPIPFDIERALFESIGRLTINDNSAIRFLEEFIEEQKE